MNNPNNSMKIYAEKPDKCPDPPRETTLKPALISSIRHLFAIFAGMNTPPKKHNWMKLPSYPGGKEAFRDFISSNVRYPDEARAAGIEGSVLVGYQVTDDGKVINAHIIKGLGYGCDEEALRVIGLLRFEKVKNRNVRVKLTTKTNIHFNINKPTVTYTVAETPQSDKPKPVAGSPKPGPSYTYTIEF